MMGIDTNGGGGCVFPLTSLQIGDLQSYLSRLNIFLVPDSEKFYILVDNSPWLEGLGLRSAWLWQLMVTKSRSSPFANMKTRRVRKNGEDMIDLKSVSTSNSSKPQRFKRWFALIDALMLSQKRVLIPVKNLKRTLLLNSEFHKTLYGFIIFEVAWSSVRGINYLNELQTDTSLAVEAKVMRRWGFDTIAQAATYLSSWFSGADSERLLWKEYLESAAGEVYYDAEEDFLRCDSYDDSDDEFFSTHDMFGDDTSSDCHQIKFSVYPTSIENDMGSHATPSLTGPYKRRKVTKSTFRGVEDGYSNETHRCTVESQDPSDNLCTSDCGIGVGATEYRDVLILFKFNDRDLPFKLRQIIMSDLRLLTLLECGLPSWVIFLQSYPGFCHLYRPWMCPLARALYVLISVITVLIGFYDLYKNVPILKASAYRLCGPLLVWIETWDMVSRIKYLGTMLFLHNVQKAVGWFLAITHTMLSFLSLLAQPMTGPVLELLSYLLPIWNMCSEAAESLCMVIWTIVGSSIGLMGELTEVLLQPMWLILSFIWNVATFVVYPIFLIFWELLYAPVRLIVAMFSLIMSTFSCVSEFLAEMWRSLSTIFQFASASERAVSSYEVSMWRSLWNDLFSQVFRAVRSILNGFVAFFTACNRHRLSIYKHTLEFIQRLFGQRPSSTDLKDGTHTCRVQALSEARW